MLVKLTEFEWIDPQRISALYFNPDYDHGNKQQPGLGYLAIHAGSVSNSHVFYGQQAHDVFEILGKHLEIER